MAFAYNTSLHQSIKTTLFFLTYCMEPWYPSFPNPAVQRFYGESIAAEWYNVLQQLLPSAGSHAQHGSYRQSGAALQHHSAATPTQAGANGVAQQNQLLGGKNRKLSPNWTEPHLILQALNNGLVELEQK